LVTEIQKYRYFRRNDIPLLKRVKDEEYVTTYLKESKKPPRKYYNLTDKGKRMSLELIKEWRILPKKVNMLLNNGEQYE